MENTVLRHHGIKGMKWGVRRTEAQLARVRGSSSSKATSKNKTETPKKKSVSEMSTDELKAVVTRLNLEKQYRDLNPVQVSAGRKFVDKMLNDVVVPAVSEVAKNTLKTLLTDGVNSALSKASKNNSDKSSKNDSNKSSKKEDDKDKKSKG